MTFYVNERSCLIFSIFPRNEFCRRFFFLSLNDLNYIIFMSNLKLIINKKNSLAQSDNHAVIKWQLKVLQKYLCDFCCLVNMGKGMTTTSCWSTFRAAIFIHVQEFFICRARFTMKIIFHQGKYVWIKYFCVCDLN